MCVKEEKIVKLSGSAPYNIKCCFDSGINVLQECKVKGNTLVEQLNLKVFNWVQMSIGVAKNRHYIKAL